MRNVIWNRVGNRINQHYGTDADDIFAVDAVSLPFSVTVDNQMMDYSNSVANDCRL